MHLRPAGYARLRLEDAGPEERNLRRTDLHQVHDVAGTGQRPLHRSRAGVRRLESPQMILAMHQLETPYPSPSAVRDRIAELFNEQRLKEAA